MSAGEWSDEVFLADTETRREVCISVRYDDPNPAEGAIFDVIAEVEGREEPLWLVMREEDARRLYRELRWMIEELDEEYGRNDDE